MQKEYDRLKALHHKHKFRFMARAGNVTPQYGAAPVPPPVPKPSRPKPSAAHIAAGYGMVRIPPAKPLPTNVEEALSPLSPSVQAFIQANLPTITVSPAAPKPAVSPAAASIAKRIQERKKKQGYLSDAEYKEHKALKILMAQNIERGTITPC